MNNEKTVGNLLENQLYRQIGQILSDPKNREQIEIAKYYERLPKPSLVAINEYLNSKLYFRNPLKENPTDF